MLTVYLSKSVVVLLVKHKVSDSIPDNINPAILYGILICLSLNIWNTIVLVLPTAIFLKLIGSFVDKSPSLWWSTTSIISASSNPSTLCSDSLWSTSITFLLCLIFLSVTLISPKQSSFLSTTG